MTKRMSPKKLKQERHRLARLPRVADIDSAWKLFWERLGDEDYIDNHRSCFVSDPAAYAEYMAAYERGCCGSFDMSVMIDGREFKMGCNHGH